MQRRHAGAGQLLQPIENGLSGPHQRIAFLGRADPREILDVRARDEAVRLAGTQYDAGGAQLGEPRQTGCQIREYGGG